MSSLKDYRRSFDIELTNRCNALCHFCPRDETPEQGFMSFDTFRQAIARAEELDTIPAISTTGQGEPMIHPEIERFVQHCAERGIPHGMTTNASLLTREKAAGLLDAGLRSISISVSDLESDYENVYALDWSNTLRNIEDFLDVNAGRAEVTINIVPHEYNSDKIQAMKSFWRNKGVERFIVFEPSNRGGACKHGNLFLNNTAQFDRAEAVLQQAGVSAMCCVPFIYLFVGWNGNYYICCNDYRKTTPLGNVFDHSIEEMDVIKRQQLGQGIQACVDCNIDPVNKVREKLLEIDAGLAGQQDLDRLLGKFTHGQRKLPEELIDLEWRAPRRVGVQNSLIEVIEVS